LQFCGSGTKGNGESVDVGEKAPTNFCSSSSPFSSFYVSKKIFDKHHYAQRVFA